MEIRFVAGLKRPRDAIESAKLVSEAAVTVRCHVRILPTWIQYRNDKDKTQFNTFVGVQKEGYTFCTPITVHGQSEPRAPPHQAGQGR